MRKHFHSRREPCQAYMICGIRYLTRYARTAQMYARHEPRLHCSASSDIVNLVLLYLWHFPSSFTFKYIEGTLKNFKKKGKNEEKKAL